MRMFYNLFVASVVYSLLMSVSLVDAAETQFMKVQGVVDIFPAGGGEAIKVEKGASINPGDVVRTGRRSRARLKFSDGSTLRVSSLSKIKIGEFSYDSESKVRKTNISNLRGKVIASVSRSDSADSYFRIQTPGAVAAVRGTVLGVEVTANSSTLTTFKGSVEFSNALGTYMVNAGQSSTVHAGRPPNIPRNLTRMELSKAAGDAESQESSDGDGGSSGESDPVTAPKVPTVATPPITTTLPGIQKQKLNLVFQL